MLVTINDLDVGFNRNSSIRLCCMNHTLLHICIQSRLYSSMIQSYSYLQWGKNERKWLPPAHNSNYSVTVVYSSPAKNLLLGWWDCGEKWVEGNPRRFLPLHPELEKRFFTAFFPEMVGHRVKGREWERQVVNISLRWTSSGMDGEAPEASSMSKVVKGLEEGNVWDMDFHRSCFPSREMWWTSASTSPLSLLVYKLPIKFFYGKCICYAAPVFIERIIHFFYSKSNPTRFIRWA